MTISEYNSTKKSIEAMIHSNPVNCEIACEILKGLDYPRGIKLDFIEPIIEGYLVMTKGLNSIGSKGALEKALVLLEKLGFLIDTVDTLKK